MVRHAAPREQPAWLAVKLWSIALGAGLPGGLAITMSASAGPSAGIAGLGVAMVLTGLARAVGLHALVTTRLRLVVGALKRIAEGDFTRRLRTGGGDDIASVIRTLDDLDDRLQSRSAALQSAGRRYRLLYEHGPAAMFRTRLDGSVVDGNPAAARMLGFAGVSEARAQNATSFYADAEARARLIERLRCRGVLANLPLTFRRQDGRRLPVRLTLMPTQEGDETYLDSVAVLDSLAVEAGEERAADDRPALALDVSLPGGVLVAS